MEFVELNALARAVRRMAERTTRASQRAFCGSGWRLNGRTISDQLPVGANPAAQGWRPRFWAGERGLPAAPADVKRCVVEARARVVAAADGVRDALEHKPALSRLKEACELHTMHTCAHRGPAVPRAPARCDGGAGFCQPTVRVLVVDDQLAFHDVAHELIDATVGFERIGGRAVASKASSRPSVFGPTWC